MCLAGTLVASWSLTQEVAGSSPFTNIFVTEFREFTENIKEKLNYFLRLPGNSASGLVSYPLLLLQYGLSETSSKSWIWSMLQK